MTTPQLFEFFKTMTRYSLWRMWAFRVGDVMTFTGESRDSVQRSLERYDKNGILLHLGGGFYTMNLPQCIPTYALYDLANWLRPYHITWLSLESRLSELSIISQVPFVLTLMTTGSSEKITTGLGRIEYTHTSNIKDLSSDLFWDKERKILIASPMRAYQDLKEANRNLGLVDLEELEECCREISG